jgi:hypothetical protein
MTNREIILEKISNARGELITALNLLQDENTDDKQFDYCTSGRLADDTDKLLNLVNRIDRIVYQKN